MQSHLQTVVEGRDKNGPVHSTPYRVLMLQYDKPLPAMTRSKTCNTTISISVGKTEKDSLLTDGESASILRHGGRLETRVPGIRDILLYMVCRSIVNS